MKQFRTAHLALVTTLITLLFAACQVVVAGSPFDIGSIFDDLEDAVNEAQEMAPIESEGSARYVLRVVKFYCGDESGSDWGGSDEPYWLFTALNPNGEARSSQSQTWGDIDSGNTREFPTQNNQDIVWPAAGAAEGALGPIELFIQLWDDEGGDPEQVLKLTRAAFDAGEWIPGIGQLVGKAPDIFKDKIAELIGDDSMGTQTIAYSADHLADNLPQVGDSFTDDYHFKEPEAFTGNPADYDLFIKVTRVQ